MPRSVTPESLRAEADALDAEAARFREEATDLRALAERMEQRATAREDSGLPLVANDATITQPMEAQKTLPSPKGRPGRKFARPSPLATAASNSGKTMGEIAEILGAPEGTVKAWNSRRRAPEPIRKKLARKPFLVPESDWDS